MPLLTDTAVLTPYIAAKAASNSPVFLPWRKDRLPLSMTSCSCASSSAPSERPDLSRMLGRTPSIAALPPLIARSSIVNLVLNKVRRPHGLSDGYLPHRSASGWTSLANSSNPARVSGPSGNSGWRTASDRITLPSHMTVLAAGRPHWRFS